MGEMDRNYGGGAKSPGTASQTDGEGASFTEGVIDLWPTKMLRRMLPGAEQASPGLVKLIRALEKDNKNLTTDYLAPDLFNRTEPEVAWLRDSVNASVVEYLKHIGINYPVDWALQAWPNVNRLGDYHDLHNHPGAYLSGTYYLKIPKNREPLRTRSDVRPGCITFYDPRPQVNMNAIAGDPYIEPEFTVSPDPGLLMLWPGFLNHFVHPNLSKETRMTISFNVVLKWKDHYRPSQ